MQPIIKFVKILTLNRQDLIEKTISKIKQLPDTKIREVSDFADLLLSKIDASLIVLQPNMALKFSLTLHARLTS